MVFLRGQCGCPESSLINSYMKGERRNTQPRANTEEYPKPVRVELGRLNLRTGRGFRKTPGTAHKLLVAMFRTKMTGSLLGELGARLKTRKERPTTQVFCFFTKKARPFSRRE